MAVSVKRQRKLGLLHILLLALLVSQASLLFQRACARALEGDRKLLAATDEVTNQVTKKESETPTTKDGTVGSNHYKGGGGGWGRGGGGGGGWSHHGGGGWDHGGGGWGHGGSGWEHRNGKKP